MNRRQRTWIWVGAAMCFVVGLLLLISDSPGAGWFLILLGLGSLATLTRTGQAWAGSGPGLAKRGLIALGVLVLFLVVIGGALFLLK